MKFDGHKWSAPELAPFAYDCFEFEPLISPDGKKLFYGTRRPLPGKTELNPRTDIWIVEKADGTWGTPYHIGLPVIDIRPMYVSSTNDGTLYLTGNKHRGIYRSSFKNGKYSIPERLPEKINKFPNAGHPFIAPDESYMIYDAASDKSSTGLFICFRNKDGSWTKPINMGEEINSTGDEICAYIPPDGKYLFFGRAINNMVDIYWVSAKIIEELKTDELK